MMKVDTLISSDPFRCTIAKANRTTDPVHLAAIAAIEKLRGRFECDTNVAGKPLVSVDLSNTKITDDGLAILREATSVKWLNLARTEVTDACVEHLVGLVELNRLVVSTTRITSAGISQLKQALPKAAIVS
ncbi:MAG: hypothetical protein U1D30_15720 [Planctomycetota bacterium]